MEKFKSLCKTVFNKITNPAIIISVVSEIIALLVLFGIDIDRDFIIKVVTSISSILVLLGIVSK